VKENLKNWQQKYGINTFRKILTSKVKKTFRIDFLTHFHTNLYFHYYKNDTKKCKFITDFELFLIFLKIFSTCLKIC